MKILITGSAGFIGGNLVRFINRETNHEIIEDSSKDLKVIPEIDVVMHQGAMAKTFDVPRPIMFECNYWRPKKLFEQLVKKGCRKFIVASSTAVYGNLEKQIEDGDVSPLNDYAESKYFFEEFARRFGHEHKVDVIILRYCNVFGPLEWKKGKMASMVYQLTDKMLGGVRPKIFKYGEQKRDWISVQDVCKLNLAAINHKGVDVFNCGSGKSISFRQLVECINTCLGSELEPDYIDNPFEQVYQRHIQCNIKKLNQVLGFKFGKIEEGIEKYVKYLRGDGDTYAS